MTDIRRQYKRAKKSRLNRVFQNQVHWFMGKLDYVRYSLGLTKPISFIITDSDESVIKILFPAHGVGSRPGNQWVVGLASPLEQAVLSYWLYIPEDFEFAKGGKLPGLAGGYPMGGGVRSDGRNGWSARYMFKEEGSICLYLYHPDMQERYGEKFFLKNGDGTIFHLSKNEWLRVQQEVRINQPENSDGHILTWINGQLLSEVRNIRLRVTETLLIDKIFFSCFAGGDDASYAPMKDCSLYFKDFKVV